MFSMSLFNFVNTWNTVITTLSVSFSTSSNICVHTWLVLIDFVLHYEFYFSSFQLGNFDWKVDMVNFTCCVLDDFVSHRYY